MAKRVQYHCNDVVATSHASDNESRNNLLLWIKDLSKVNIRKVESLCSGVIYCQLMDMLFPGSINLKKVKVDASVEYDYFNNFKQLQAGLQAVGCEKEINVQKIIKGGFQENFEFLQWFKRFFDANLDGNDSNKHVHDYAVKCLAKSLESKKNTSQVRPGTSGPRSAVKREKKLQCEDMKSATGYNMEAEDLKSQVEYVTERARVLEKEKNFFYNKLLNIEMICTRADSEEGPLDKATFIAEICNELYATADEQVEEPEDQGEEEAEADKTF